MNPRKGEINTPTIEASQEAEILEGMQIAMPFLEKLRKDGTVATFSPIVDGQRQDTVTIALYHAHRSAMGAISTWEILRKDHPALLVSKVQATSSKEPEYRFEEAYNLGDPANEVREPASLQTAWFGVGMLVNATRRDHEQATWERVRKPSKRLADVGHHVLAFFHLQHT